MRRLVFILLVLASCGGPPPPAAPETRINCRPAGAAEYARACTVERVGNRLTVSKPDGGFRRFRIMPGGVIMPADGAEPVRITVRPDGEMEIEVGGDRFAFPPDFAGQ